MTIISTFPHFGIGDYDFAYVSALVEVIIKGGRAIYIAPRSIEYNFGTNPVSLFLSLVTWKNSNVIARVVTRYVMDNYVSRGARLEKYQSYAQTFALVHFPRKFSTSDL